MTLTHRDLLAETYDAFNARDIERALAAMHPEVDWPNGMEGEFIHGRNEVGAYWIWQWRMIDPRVEPRHFSVDAHGRAVVDVYQAVQDGSGKVVREHTVHHIYQIEGRPDQAHGDQDMIGAGCPTRRARTDGQATASLCRRRC